ncbi:MAG: sulfatase [Prolixibacteraceae bacterium]|jgi:iduronate 2-sulfatase|nr:sulfatase [Prolixibacteraceae bacterium]MBT6004624.1 sulfatase [Prolixibacteraceae bacterium]MBT6763151.1 sulfatase [Prolixibacteraceae bacterium]MBT7000206.1 sulfatase [Prolixibacteraceae bacterium]MBT7393811.1 sulfatase [Prolixibacteraceae bacterium]
MKCKSTFLLLFLLTFGFTNTQSQNKPNVLFIAVDDLRPELGCYGQSHIKSPNIDKLAESGLVFNRAYCNIPVCGASRASIMSGIRPNKHRFLNYSCWQDLDVPGIVSLPMHFKNNGYKTVSLGKIYHHITDGKGSWSETPWSPNGDWQGWQAYVLPESHEQIEPRKNGIGINGPSFESPDGPDHIYPDGIIANEAVRKLNEFKNNENPFFLAVGFLKPHLPFNAPKKYWDLYDFDKIELPENMRKPDNAPDECMHNFGELRNYTDVPDNGPMDDEFMRKLIHGYYACVSYTDTQIGKVLNELKRLGLAENTIVILWGDHGWHLGEHGLWCKHCNFEKVLHTPLILKAPGKKKNIKTNALVEYVDIYPSLCELAGLEKPFHLQGKSFVPLTENAQQPWKEEIYCRWIKGETIVTQTHTYTEWLNNNTGETTARMLYNLVEDPEETVNISEKKGNKKLINELSAKLEKHISDRDKLIIP